ncbi:SH3 domain-containing protein [Peribacillus sp. SCS-155]|uniref:SH3 domain-containing protein n=1 Tax=Peribacillus sedimenti TaxID=3115297 RepID=UPI003905FF5A
MKSRIGILIASMMLFLSVFSVTNSTNQAFAAVQFKVNASALNVRENPNTTAKIIGTFAKGQSISGLQDLGGWTKVNVGSKTGWVMSKYLSKPSAGTAVKIGYVNTSQLNLRQSYSTSSKSLALLTKDTQVTIQSQKGSWLKVYLSSKKLTGWVLNSYISDKKTAAATSSAKTAVTGSKYYVTGNELNIRTQPNTSGKVTTSVKKGTALTLYEKKGDWGRVKTAEGKTGWASLKFLTTKAPAVASAPTVKPAPAPAVKTVKNFITASKLNIRSKPSTSAGIVTILKKGDSVTLYQKDGSWGKVTTSTGKSGWASLSYLSSQQPVAAPVPAPPKTDEPVTENPGNNTPEDTELTPAPSETVYLRDDSNIRTGPGTSYNVITLEKKGSAVTKIGEKDGWVQVVTASGKTGWVAAWLTGTKEKGLKGKVIVVDAGHGGKDPGTSGINNTEKALNLKVALELQALLKSKGATVIMTRSNDTYPTLTERVNVSNQYKADAFISIHFNANGDKSVSGIDTFYYASNTNEKQLAQCIQEEVIKQAKLLNRGVKQGNFQVIRENKQAAILIELGFLSNPNEEKIVETSEYQKRAALGIFNGLEKFFSL